MRMPRNEDVLNDYPYIYYDTKNFFVEATNFLITGNDIDLIFLFLSSDVGFYIFSKFYTGPQFDDTGFRYKKAYLNNLVIPRFDKRTAKQLRAAMTDIVSNRATVERIFENLCHFDEREKETIRAYKRQLLSIDR